MARQRKMVGITVEETSGVDHPAHLHEGWVVCKSAPAARVEDAFGSLNKPKEGPVPDLKKNEGGEGTEQVLETVPKADFDAAVAEKDARIAELEAAAAAPAAAEGEGEDELLKSVPQAVRDILAKAAADQAETREALNKERDARLDGEAITKSKATFKSLAISHDEVAPALRRVAAIDAGLAKSIETALKAADGQLESAGILFKEVGQETGNSTEGRLEKAAKDLVERKVVGSYSQGIAKALELDPTLYTEYMNEKAGK